MDNHFNPNNNIKDFSENKYPIILIPDKIQNSIKKEISKEEAYKYLGIDLPKLKVLQKPVPPSPFYYEPRKTIKLGSDGCSVLPFLIILAITFISLLAAGAFIGVLVIGVGVAIIATTSDVFRTERKSERIDVPKDVYEQKMADYKRKLEVVSNKNIQFKHEYSLALKIIENSVAETKIERAKKNIYYSALKPESSFSRNLDNRIRGRTELMFLNKLYQKFNKQIKVDVILDGNNFYPDFTLICNQTGLHVDIEIDEPYTIKDKEPIHYIDSGDKYRDECFLQQNWCVIRFAEKQIAQQPNECIEFIQNLIEAIQNYSLSFYHNVSEIPKWSYEEALVMAFNNGRDNYYLNF